jgi:hypothetical protein
MDTLPPELIGVIVAFLDPLSRQAWAMTCVAARDRFLAHGFLVYTHLPKKWIGLWYYMDKPWFHCFSYRDRIARVFPGYYGFIYKAFAEGPVWLHEWMMELSTYGKSNANKRLVFSMFRALDGPRAVSAFHYFVDETGWSFRHKRTNRYYYALTWDDLCLSFPPHPTWVDGTCRDVRVLDRR